MFGGVDGGGSREGGSAYKKRYTHHIDDILGGFKARGRLEPSDRILIARGRLGELAPLEALGTARTRRRRLGEALAQREVRFPTGGVEGGV